MPMHLTRNYDGQFSGNSGIHARYEIEMIDRYHDQISYSGTPAAEISDVTRYFFSYIYSSYVYMDSILIADDYAKEMTGGTSSGLYYSALWERTEHLTNELFKQASHAMAELLYTAWIEAGGPLVGGDIRGDRHFEHVPGKIKISPNPVKHGEPLNFQFPFSGDVFATVYDTYGRKTHIMTALPTEPENHSFALNSSGLSAGSYFIVLENCYDWQASEPSYTRIIKPGPVVVTP